MRAASGTFAAAVAAAALGAGCGGDERLDVGDCSDADPNFVVTAVEPKIVDCDAKDAKSRVVKKVDERRNCPGPAIRQLGSYFCLRPIAGKSLTIPTTKPPPIPTPTLPETSPEPKKLPKTLPTP